MYRKSNNIDYMYRNTDMNTEHVLYSSDITV